MGEPVEEIRRPVQGIDDPFVVIAGLVSAFFGQDRVIGVGPAQDLDYLGFREPVYFRDEIAATLGLDVYSIKPIQMAHDNIAGAARGLDRRIEHRMHERGCSAKSRWRALYRGRPRQESDGGCSSCL